MRCTKCYKKPLKEFYIIDAGIGAYGINNTIAKKTHKKASHGIIRENFHVQILSYGFSKNEIWGIDDENKEVKIMCKICYQIENIKK